MYILIQLVIYSEYSTDLIKEHAVHVINNYNEGDSPMFMWVTFTAPHTPLQAPQEYIDMYPSVVGDRQTYLGEKIVNEQFHNLQMYST